MTVELAIYVADLDEFSELLTALRENLDELPTPVYDALLKLSEADKNANHTWH